MTAIKIIILLMCLMSGYLSPLSYPLFLQEDNSQIIVDEVKEVVTLMEDQVEKVAYEYGKDDLNSYLVGVGKYNNELISLLNINGVISEQEKGEN